MPKLSLLLRRLLDDDTRTLIRAGIFDNGLKVQNPGFVLEFVANKFKKELAAEAEKLPHKKIITK